MFWNLLLAHFTSDFLLQTDWMVRNRDKFWVLSLHGSIHLGMMLLLLGQSRSEFWSIVALLALIHMGQDALKVYLLRKKPGWLVPAFILDQILHYVIIGAFIWVFQIGVGTFGMTQKTTWVMVAISYLFVTYVWFASERILYFSNPEYVLKINETKFSRMMVRVGMLSTFLIVRTWIYPGLLMVLPDPYISSKYRQRVLLTDLSVSIFAMIFLFWGLG